MNGHGNPITSQTVQEGSKATQPAAPVADGFLFGGWYKDAACTARFDFASPISGNTTVYAKWTKVTVPAKTGDGSQPLMWMVLLACSGILLAGTVIKRKKYLK